MSDKELTVLEENFPINYREEICKEIFSNIIRLESFSIVGIADNSQANLLRFITIRKDVKKKYLKEHYLDYKFVLVDLNDLPDFSAQSFYKLLLISVGKKNICGVDAVELLGELKRELGSYIKRTNKKVVILFNHYDLIHKTGVYNGLKALRMVSRFNIIYVFSLRKPALEKEFFFNKIIWARPFCKKEAMWVIERNSERYGRNLSPKEKEEILYLSGGHTGFIKFLAREPYSIKTLLSNCDINLQCKRILCSLSDLDKVRLKAGEKDHLFLNLGLQVAKGNEFVIFSPILEKFLDLDGGGIKALELGTNGEVYVCGKRIDSELTDEELLLLKTLSKNISGISKREELMQKIWGEEVPTDWAFDKLVSRLRSKLSRFGNSKINFIRTIRNVGLKLNNG